MSETMLKGPGFPGELLRATDLVCIVHLEDGVLAEVDKALQFFLVATHIHRVKEVPP